MYFQPEDNRETRTVEREKVTKNNRFKHELKIYILFNFVPLSEGVEKLGKVETLVSLPTPRMVPKSEYLVSSTELIT